MEYEPRLSKSKGRFSKLVVMLSYLMLISFTVVVLILVSDGIYVQDSLIYAFYGFFGTEMVALAYRTKT